MVRYLEKCGVCCRVDESVLVTKKTSTGAWYSVCCRLNESVLGRKKQVDEHGMLSVAEWRRMSTHTWTSYGPSTTPPSSTVPPWTSWTSMSRAKNMFYNIEDIPKIYALPSNGVSGIVLQFCAHHPVPPLIEGGGGGRGGIVN